MIFSKKPKGELEEALKQGLITREELLRLKLERATREMLEFDKKNGVKKPKGKK